MSHYIIPAYRGHAYMVAVGWDSSIPSFFAQVLDMTGDHDDFEVISAGTTAGGEIADPVELVAAIADYAPVPTDILTQLVADKAADPAPDPAPDSAAVGGERSTQATEIPHDWTVWSPAAPSGTSAVPLVVESRRIPCPVCVREGRRPAGNVWRWRTADDHVPVCVDCGFWPRGLALPTPEFPPSTS